MLLCCRNALTIASGSRGSLSSIFPALRSDRIEQIVRPSAGFSNRNAIMKAGRTFARWFPYSCGMETSGEEPQGVVPQVYALMGSCCDARARSATQAVDRAGVAQDTQQFRPRPLALVRRPPW